jgi:hypothetical protein
MIFVICFLATVVHSFAALQQEIKLPAKVLESIQSTYNAEKMDLEPEVVDVELEIKVKSGEHKFPLGYTQEILDLAQYISTKDNSLGWRLVVPYKVDAKSTTMYFFPRYKPYTSPMGKIHGYDCGSVFKYAKNIGDLINVDALNIMTNGRQYLSILGGDYLVLHLEGKKLKMSYFKVRDTRWTHELCKLDY